MSKNYMIFNQAGELLASMPFRDAQECFGFRHIAVRVTPKGKHQVRWLCSGLDANAEENDQALAIIRKHNNGNLPR